MDDMMNKIGDILSDPESVKQITELAQMLMSETSNNSNVSDQNTESKINTDNSGNSDNNLFSGLDFSKLMKLQEIMGAVSGSDKNTELLLALKPHLSPDKQKKTDKAIKLLKVMAIFNIIKDSGMLKDFFN